MIKFSIQLLDDCKDTPEKIERNSKIGSFTI